MWKVKYPAGYDVPNRGLFNEICTIWPGGVVTMAGKLVNLLSPDTGLPASFNPHLHFIRTALVHPGIYLPGGAQAHYDAIRVFTFYNPGFSAAELAVAARCMRLDAVEGEFEWNAVLRHSWSVSDGFQFLIAGVAAIDWLMAVPAGLSDIYKSVDGVLEENNAALKGLTATHLCIMRRFNSALDPTSSSHSGLGIASSPKIHYALELIPEGFLE